MHQFFVEPDRIDEGGRRILIQGEDGAHIKNVLRMKAGEEISVRNGLDGREFRCGILEYGPEGVVCELRFVKEENVELPCRIHLFQALPKGDKMEYVIQKAVELGVYRVIPVASARCVVKLDGKKAASKVQRWQGIARAAAQQSRRALVPQVGQVAGFREALEEAAGMDVKLIPYELAEDMAKTRALLEKIRPGGQAAVFIGPEGGFAESEIALALERGVEPVTLGRRILRTETAGLAVLSWILYLTEN